MKTFEKTCVGVPCELWQKIAECLQTYAMLFPSCSTMSTFLAERQRREILANTATMTDEIIDAMNIIGV